MFFFDIITCLNYYSPFYPTCAHRRLQLTDASALHLPVPNPVLHSFLYNARGEPLALIH